MSPTEQAPSNGGLLALGEKCGCAQGEAAHPLRNRRSEMSTKIYNGYRLAGGRSETMLVRELSEQARRLHRELSIKALAVLTPVVLEGGSVEDLTSGLVTDEEIDEGSALRRAARVLDLAGKRSRERGMRISPLLDRDVSVCFVADPEDSWHTLALLYTERREYQDLWESIEGVETWPYWNNTDRPDELSQEEWDARGAAWARAIGWKAPSEVGLGWDLHEDNAGFLLSCEESFALEVAASTCALLNERGRERYGTSPEAVLEVITAMPEQATR